MVFEALYPQMDFSDELIQKINGIFDTNAIEIRLTQSEVQYSTMYSQRRNKSKFRCH